MEGGNTWSCKKTTLAGERYQYKAGRTDKLLLRFYTLNEYYKADYSGYGDNVGLEHVVKMLGIPGEEVVAAVRYLEKKGLVVSSRDGTAKHITAGGTDAIEVALRSIGTPKDDSAKILDSYTNNPDAYHLYIDKIRKRVLEGDRKDSEVISRLKNSIWAGFQLSRD